MKSFKETFEDPFVTSTGHTGDIPEQMPGNILVYVITCTLDNKYYIYYISIPDKFNIHWTRNKNNATRYSTEEKAQQVIDHYICLTKPNLRSYYQIIPL